MLLYEDALQKYILRFLSFLLSFSSQSFEHSSLLSLYRMFIKKYYMEHTESPTKIMDI